MSLEGFEVAVVGAGPAGSAAAITLAREGVQVLLVERGTFPGSKNVFGGRIYSYALKKLLGDSWKDAPVERFVRKEGITFMTSDNAFSVEFESKDPEGSFTAKRAKFDKWLAEQAEKAGASLITESRVDDLIMDGGRVRGIVAGQDKIPTDVVIACDGTTTGLARRAGLASMRSEEHTSELQSRSDLVCRLLLEKKKKIKNVTSLIIRNVGETALKWKRCLNNHHLS